MRVTGVCVVCSSPATQRCAGCYSVAYCSPACQKQDWPLHKAACTKPYTVKESKVAGRFMVATRSLQPGDIVLRERAAVVGPSLEGSNPVMQPTLVNCTELYCTAGLPWLLGLAGPDLAPLLRLPGPALQQEV